MSFEVTGANLLFLLLKNDYVILFLTVKAGLSNTFNSSRKNVIEFKSVFYFFFLHVENNAIYQNQLSELRVFKWCAYYSTRKAMNDFTCRHKS